MGVCGQIVQAALRYLQVSHDMTPPSNVPLTAHLATPGTPEYFQSVLSRAGETHPELPLDPVILQSLLLCLIAGKHPAGHGRSVQNHTRCKNLILRTKEEDVSLVLNIVAMSHTSTQIPDVEFLLGVSLYSGVEHITDTFQLQCWSSNGRTLTMVLGFPAYKSKIKEGVSTSSSGRRKRTGQSHAHQHPEAFLRSLFFRDPKPSPVIREISASERDGGSKKSGRRAGKRSSNALQGSGSILSVSPSSAHLTDTTDDSFIEVATLASSRRPFVTPASTMRHRPHPSRVQTDPSPLVSLFVPPLSASQTSPAENRRHASASLVLPKGLVVSGLHHANVPSQRALTRVLSERKLVLDGDNTVDNQSDIHDKIGETWNLPDDFLLIYVCPSDPHDRPNILPGLADKFSLSVEVNITSSTRQTYLTHRGSQHSTPISSPYHSPISLPPRSPLNPSASLPLLEPTLTPRNSSFRSPPLQASARSLGAVIPPVISSVDLAQLRTLANPASTSCTSVPTPENSRYDMVSQFVYAHTSIHPSLQIYLSDLFAAARHHPELDGVQLTLQAHRDAEDFARAFRVIGGDSLGTELIETLANRPPSLRLSESTESYDRISRVDIESMGWGKEEQDILMGFERQNVEVRIYAPDTPALGGSGLPSQAVSDVSLPPAEETWDVSEVDIARVFPRVVSHRISVRRGPDDEIFGSIMFPAAGHPADADMPDRESHPPRRRTVKEILVEILADV